MPNMDTAHVRAILQAERANAMAAVAASKLSDDRARATEYYLGDVRRDIPDPVGRSKAVSTDVADTIEGLMPQLMDMLWGNDDVVEFTPIGPNDIEAARQETDYLNYVFKQLNPGFMVGYAMTKDALLSKTGVVKIWWEAKEVDFAETYEHLDELQVQALIADQKDGKFLDIDIEEVPAETPDDNSPALEPAIDPPR